MGDVDFLSDSTKVYTDIARSVAETNDHYSFACQIVRATTDCLASEISIDIVLTP